MNCGAMSNEMTFTNCLTSTFTRHFISGSVVSGLILPNMREKRSAPLFVWTSGTIRLSNGPCDNGVKMSLYHHLSGPGNGVTRLINVCHGDIEVIDLFCDNVILGAMNVCANIINRKRRLNECYNNTSVSPWRRVSLMRENIFFGRTVNHFGRTTT